MPHYQSYNEPDVTKLTSKFCNGQSCVQLSREQDVKKLLVKVWSNLLLRCEISQAKSSHFNRNLCVWEFRMRLKKFPMQICCADQQKTWLKVTCVSGASYITALLSFDLFSKWNFAEISLMWPNVYTLLKPRFKFHCWIFLLFEMHKNYEQIENIRKKSWDSNTICQNPLI